MDEKTMNNSERSGGDFRDVKFYTIESAALSEKRADHEINQDTSLIFINGKLFTAVVSDGIGGLPGGEIASQRVTTASREVADRETSEKEPLQKILKDMIEMSDTDVRDEKILDTHYQMGATFAGLLIRNGKFACANVGDTRIYCKSNGVLIPLSVDHTEGAAMLAEDAAPEEANKKNNVLTQYIGYGMEKIEPNYRQMPIKSGEIFLLTSDGIHTRLTDHELFDLIDERESAEIIAQKIMAAAKERGFTDDATVVVVKVS